MKRSIILLSLLLVSAFCRPGTLQAADNGNAAASYSITTTKEDMLLFWEEKDLYVQTATRNEKLLSQTAENMVVVTSKDIEEMNAHSVDEVLNRVTGVYVDPQGQDFGSASLLHIQGSADRHVLVMLDGVVLNFLDGGQAITRAIPVSIIERIEIIKGPASSAWGSSLGGVINIITKQTGDTGRPTGMASVAYGKKDSQDYSGQLAGAAGRLGYYLYAGRQASDGLKNSRFFEDNSVYAKLKFRASADTTIGFSIGSSRPDYNAGIASLHNSLIDIDLSSKSLISQLFMTLSLDTKITPELAMNVHLSDYRQKFSQVALLLSDYIYHSPTGDLTLGHAGDYYKGSFISDEKTRMGNVRFVWDHGIHTVILGLDTSHGELEKTNNVPPATVNPSIDKWAVFVNDTVKLGRLTIIPGIRFDHDNSGLSFTSPSIGVTCKISERTIARASVARGFNSPPLGSRYGDSFSTETNPDLKMESVWSYQAGLESNITDYVWMKATAFYHNMKNEIITTRGDILPNRYANGGRVKRHGVELEAETAPIYNISVKAGAAYAHINPDLATSKSFERDLSSYVLSIKYDDKKSFMAQLSGYRILWGSLPDDGAKYDNFIWDLNVMKNIYKTEETNAAVFLTVHNLFSGPYYNLSATPNPGIWSEAGIRFRF